MANLSNRLTYFFLYLLQAVRARDGESGKRPQRQPEWGVVPHHVVRPGPDVGRHDAGAVARRRGLGRVRGPGQRRRRGPAPRVARLVRRRRQRCRHPGPPPGRLDAAASRRPPQRLGRSHQHRYGSF